MNTEINLDHFDIRRERTAIARFRHSKPVMLALSHDIIERSKSFFDFGCGRGEDVRYLRSAGIEATGWDPHHRPEAKLCCADVVNLGYVLNVIEDPTERSETLRRAFELARQVLVVAVRVDQGLEIGVEFSDGVLTSCGSFQKFYKQSEFREYIEQILGRRPHMVGLGVAYVFRDGVVESSYLASLSRRRFEASRTSAIEEFSQDVIAKRYLELAVALGRPPVAGEFSEYPELLERFGSSERVAKLARQLLSPEAIRESQQRRREDILTYIAMMRLQGLKSLPFRALPNELRADIKMLWTSYPAALHEGETFLFQIGNPESVRSACKDARVGKNLPEAFYIHRSAEEELGALLRLLIFAAHQVVGEVDYNVAKISLDGRSISLLRYDLFEEEAHPALRYSVRVYLPRSEYAIRDYSKSKNPPILHRKDALIDPLHQRYKTFAELTNREEELGLLSRSDIGNEQGWRAALAEKGITIMGHSICPAPPSVATLDLSSSSE